MGLNNHNYEMLFIDLIKLHIYVDKIRRIVGNNNYDCDSPVDKALDRIENIIFESFCQDNNLNPTFQNVDKASQYFCDCLNEQDYFDIQTYISFLSG